jgi:hypothetical protein
LLALQRVQRGQRAAHGRRRGVVGRGGARRRRRLVR